MPRRCARPTQGGSNATTAGYGKSQARPRGSTPAKQGEKCKDEFDDKVLNVAVSNPHPASPLSGGGAN
ncbi:hypothetical protein, partial [Brenneria goodwinii]